MKAIIILAIVTLGACSDDPTFCCECTVVEESGTSTFTRCDVTEMEMARIERSGSEIYSPYRTPYIVGYTKQTTCVKTSP